MNGKIRVRGRAKTSGEVSICNNLMGRRSKSGLRCWQEKHSTMIDLRRTKIELSWTRGRHEWTQREQAKGVLIDLGVGKCKMLK